MDPYTEWKDITEDDLMFPDEMPPTLYIDSKIMSGSYYDLIRNGIWMSMKVDSPYHEEFKIRKYL